MISSGQLGVGEKLPPERALAEQLDVSRTTLRESLHELEIKGLVSRRPGRGTVVTTPSDPGYSRQISRNLRRATDSFQEVMQLRRAVEPGVAALAAHNSRPEHISKLHKLLEAAESASGAQLHLELDADFHATIADAAANALLSHLVRDINDLAHRTRRLGFQSPARQALSWRGHDAICAALSAGDPDMAEAAMKRHLDEVIKLVAGHGTSPESEVAEPPAK